MWTVCCRPPLLRVLNADSFSRWTIKTSAATLETRQGGSNVGLKMMWTIRTIKPLKSAPVPGHCGKQYLSPIALLLRMWSTNINQGDWGELETQDLGWSSHKYPWRCDTYKEVSEMTLGIGRDSLYHKCSAFLEDWDVNVNVTHIMLSMPCRRSLSRSSSLEVERPSMGELKHEG